MLQGRGEKSSASSRTLGLLPPPQNLEPTPRRVEMVHATTLELLLLLAVVDIYRGADAAATTSTAASVEAPVASRRAQRDGATRPPSSSHPRVLAKLDSLSLSLCLCLLLFL